jgi:hypothetical protein
MKTPDGEEDQDNDAQQESKSRKDIIHMCVCIRLRRGVIFACFLNGWSLELVVLEQENHYRIQTS